MTKNFVALKDDSIEFRFSCEYFDINGVSHADKYNKLRQYLVFLESLGIVEEKTGEAGIEILFNDKYPSRIFTQITGADTDKYIKFTALALDPETSAQMVEEFSKFTGFDEYNVHDDVLGKDTEDLVEASKILMEEHSGGITYET
jgi:hypothetical protein